MDAALLSPELRVAASPDLLARGCVCVIGLDHIRSATGARWEKSRHSVWAHLENLLRQRLAPTDFYTRLDDVSMLVSLPALGMEEAQICCLRVAQELNAMMMGSSEPEDVILQRAVPAPDGGIATEHIPAIRLRELASRGGMSEHAAQPRTASGAAEPGELRHRFQPVWNAQKQAVTTWRCFSIAPPHAPAVPTPQASLRHELAMTRSRIQHATRILSEKLQVQQRFLLWLPLSFEMMSAPVSRMEIAAALRELPGELRPYLMFEIENLPYGVPQSRLSELVGALKPFGRGVVAQLPARTANYSAYLGAGLHGIGLSLNSETVRGAEMLTEIFKLGVASARQSVMSFVLDIASEELLEAARASGISLISGPLVGETADSPAPVRRLSAADLLHRTAA